MQPGSLVVLGAPALVLAPVRAARDPLALDVDDPLLGLDVRLELGAWLRLGLRCSARRGLQCRCGERQLKNGGYNKAHDVSSLGVRDDRALVICPSVASTVPEVHGK